VGVRDDPLAAHELDRLVALVGDADAIGEEVLVLGGRAALGDEGAAHLHADAASGRIAQCCVARWLNETRRVSTAMLRARPRGCQRSAGTGTARASRGRAGRNAITTAPASMSRLRVTRKAPTPLVQLFSSFFATDVQPQFSTSIPRASTEPAASRN